MTLRNVLATWLIRNESFAMEIDVGFSDSDCTCLFPQLLKNKHTFYNVIFQFLYLFILRVYLQYERILKIRRFASHIVGPNNRIEDI